MYSFLRVVAMSLAWLCLLSTGTAWAQNSPQEARQLGVQAGFSAWSNNCDIPSGGQDTGKQPSFGPSFRLRYGRFRLGGTVFLGNFDVEPHDGIEFNASNKIQFSDAEARKRGFTTSGTTKRLDVSLNFGYEFNRYAQLSFSLIVNRHKADIATYWFPLDDGKGNVTRVPSKAAFLFAYTDTQVWVGQGFQGSIPVQTLSSRFSLFYNTSIVILAGESGDGKVEFPRNQLTTTSPRVSYLGVASPGAVKDQGNRPFGANAGLAFNTGASLQLLKALDVYGGYNFKFFAEDETSIIDHSKFHGPFFGFNVTIK